MLMLYNHSNVESHVTLATVNVDTRFRNPSSTPYVISYKYGKCAGVGDS